MKHRIPPEAALLSREAFKELVFARARGLCVFCSRPAVDAHHVMERKLYPDGGFYLGNGAAVCEEHHWDCEVTKVTLGEVRAAAGIAVPVLPPGFDPALTYDKWGNRCLATGLRIWGPLETDDGARKALARGGFLSLLLPATAAVHQEGETS